ncbi:hypothetical protein EGH21_00920 [Halomicroarcula sp. F13]|uniref:Secreted protein n=1 Tax=Haloarcula rubra TaxID=2487747 RepID=A0AAW4PKI5_9EURY|nr:hypothetical protein [Halomicroarcula rubra]MBX0321580.1 hypothetical protein [Halomicroarcula rubra]
MPVHANRTLRYVAVLVVLAAAVLAVGATTAERRALDAESEYVDHRLEQQAACLSDWGTDEGAGPSRDAEIRQVTLGGVYVDVTVPYAYTVGTGDDRVFADTASRATYVVTPTTTTRVGGDDVAVC